MRRPGRPPRMAAKPLRLPARKATTLSAMQHAKITSKGQTTIPAEVRRKLGLEPGDRLSFEEREGGYFVRKDPGVDALFGCLSHLVENVNEGKTMQEVIDAEKAYAAEAWARSGAAGEFQDAPADAA